MIRRICVCFSLIVAGALPAAGQTHPASHIATHPHDSLGHTPMDSARHAALHALLHGSWTGTFKSAHGDSTGMELSVGFDSASMVKLAMSIHQHPQLGTAGDFAMRGDTIRWTQVVEGKPCRTTALVTPGSPHVADIM